MDHKGQGVADKAKGTGKDIRGKRPQPDFDKPLGSSHNDEADLRDVAQEAAKRQNSRDGLVNYAALAALPALHGAAGAHCQFFGLSGAAVWN